MSVFEDSQHAFCANESDWVLICRGKTLGGGTSINGAAYTRGMQSQYDSLPKLLEASDASMDWTFDSLFYYMKKVYSSYPY